MAKKDYFYRYILILQCLRQYKYVSSHNLQEYINKRLKDRNSIDDTFGLIGSKKTLQRDLKDIEKLFGICIEYSPQEKGYSIVNKESNAVYQRWIDEFEIFNSLNIVDNAKQFVFMENRKPKGIENLYGLLHCIKNKVKIKILYHNYWMEEPEYFTLEPIGLREFKNRWYVLVKENNTNLINRYAFDRIKELEITNQRFKDSRYYNLNEYYQNCFGIIGPEDLKNEEERTPQEIVLSFESYQGNYIKSLPLHHSQEIIIDNDQELRIKLKLYITFDFIMELLSYSEKVRVIKPQSLIDEIRRKLNASLANYEKVN
jgi:predicted DNA-binding transcriptional regulator YafY